MKQSLYFFVSMLLIISCNNEEHSSELTEVETVEKIIVAKDQTEFIHTVFFWMDSTLTTSQLAEFEAGMGELLKIETIEKGYYGPPAMTPREVVDNSYDYAFVVHFKSKEEHDLYQQDSLHLNFISQYKTYWTRIQIYDNLVADSK